jgi:hypothetical protein
LSALNHFTVPCATGSSPEPTRAPNTFPLFHEGVDSEGEKYTPLQAFHYTVPDFHWVYNKARKERNFRLSVIGKFLTQQEG